MPRVDLPLGLQGSENLPRTRRDLVNCFNNGAGKILSRPGIEQLTTTSKIARGQFEWNGDLYQVQSTDLVKITNTDTGAGTVIGTIAGIAPIEWDVGFNDAVIVVRGGAIYALSNSTTTIAVSGVTDSGGVARFTHAGATPAVGNTITISGFITNTLYNVTGIVTASTATTFEISSISFGTDETGLFTLVLSDISGNSNFEPCIDVAHINGRFVYIPTSGEPAFFSDVGAAGTVQALSFFDAEELPDKNNAVFNGKNTLYILGTDSIELFRDTGASPNPFIRINGSRILNGYIGGLLEYNNTFLFIGREKGQDRGIYSIVQGGAAKISNETIDLILAKHTDAQLEAAISGRFKWRGYDIATFTLADNSFGFFGGYWFTLESLYINGSSGPWKAGYITEFEGEYFTAFSNLIGKFAKINTDYGEPMTKIIDTGFEDPDGEFFSAQSLELGISQGHNTSVGAVALLMSRDNVQYGPALFRDLGNIGQYQNKLIWNYPGGLGTYDGFMGVRIYTRENVDFAVDYMIFQ